MMYYTTRALMLSRVPQGERGSAMTLLTEERGMVTAQGQGVMPARSKLGPSLTPYRLLSVTCTTRVIERVIGVEVLETYGLLWREPKRQGYAAWALDAVRSCVKPGSADARLFALTLEYLRALNDAPTPEIAFPFLRLAFAVKFIGLLGYHGSMVHETAMKSVIDRARDARTLADAGTLLRPMGKRIHGRIEQALRELSGDAPSHPARFLTALC